MKNLAIVLLVLTPSCGALKLGSDATPEQTEATIQAAEGTISTVGNMVIPGAGGALAVLFGLGARTWLKRRKAAKA